GGGGLSGELRRQIAQVTGAALAHTELDHAHRQRRDAALEESEHDRPHAVRWKLGVGERRAHLARTLDLAADLVQLVLDALEDTLGPGDFENAGGVTSDPVHYLLFSSVMYRSTRPSWAARSRA